MKPNSNPCIDICQFTGPKGWCVGCGRTRQEASEWKGMKPYHRTMVVKQLTKRMEKIKHNDSDS